MPVLVEHHVAGHANAVRFAAAAGCAAADAERLSDSRPDAAGRSILQLRASAERLRKVGRITALGATGSLAETLRRVRHQPIPATGDDHLAPAAMLIEAVGALREASLTLDVARQAAAGSHLEDASEGLPGRHGELALALVMWSGQVWEIAGGSAAGIEPERVAWGPQPTDDRVLAPLALALCACFIASGVMSVRIGLSDAKQLSAYPVGSIRAV